MIGQPRDGAIDQGARQVKVALREGAHREEGEGARVLRRGDADALERVCGGIDLAHAREAFGFVGQGLHGGGEGGVGVHGAAAAERRNIIAALGRGGRKK
ncbi:MAG: hypothetical protein LKM39_17305 [Chiayiivirga sp.]|nr:hypothetical protein [Chiayiivirga sp.]